MRCGTSQKSVPAPFFCAHYFADNQGTFSPGGGCGQNVKTDHIGLIGEIRDGLRLSRENEAQMRLVRASESLTRTLGRVQQVTARTRIPAVYAASRWDARYVSMAS